MCPTHRWAGKGGYRGQKACHFQRKINVISQLGLLHTGTLFSRSFKQNGCVPVAPLGYPSQPLPQMKATRIIFSVPTSLLQFNAVFILNTSAYTHRMAKMVKKTQAVLWQPTWPKWLWAIWPFVTDKKRTKQTKPTLEWGSGLNGCC